MTSYTDRIDALFDATLDQQDRIIGVLRIMLAAAEAGDVQACVLAIHAGETNPDGSHRSPALAEGPADHLTAMLVGLTNGLATIVGDPMLPLRISMMTSAAITVEEPADVRH